MRSGRPIPAHRARRVHRAFSRRYGPRATPPPLPPQTPPDRDAATAAARPPGSLAPRPHASHARPRVGRAPRAKPLHRRPGPRRGDGRPNPQHAGEVRYRPLTPRRRPAVSGRHENPGRRADSIFRGARRAAGVHRLPRPACRQNHHAAKFFAEVFLQTKTDRTVLGSPQPLGKARSSTSISGEPRSKVESDMVSRASALRLEPHRHHPRQCGRFVQ